MTQDLQEKIRVVQNYCLGTQYVTTQHFNYEPVLDDFNTNISSIYPVAKRVVSELAAMINLPETDTDTKWELLAAETRIDNNIWDIPALFQSTYEGIILLNKLKTEK